MDFYVALYNRFHLGPAALTGVRFALAAYLLMPFLGVRATIGLACGVNFAIFAAVALIGRRSGTQSVNEVELPASPVAGEEALPRVSAKVLVIGAFLTGGVALAYEVVWTHVLAFLIGNTFYAFGVMLFTFLCGLGVGAQVVARHFPSPTVWPRVLAGSQLFLALAVFCTLPLWNRIPDVFAPGIMRAFEFNLLSIAFLLLGRMAYLAWKILRRPRAACFPLPRAVELGLEGIILAVMLSGDMSPLWKHETSFFVAAELLRLFLAFYLLIIPSLLLGLTFLLLLNLASHRAARVGGSVGGIYAANTAGAIAGLEYQTPKGNSLPYNTVSLNINFMLKLRPADPCLRTWRFIT